MLDRTKAPDFKTLTNLTVPKIQLVKLPNGVTLYHFRSDNVEVVKIEFVFDAGTWFEKVSSASFFTGKSFLSGTQKRKSNEILELIDFYGAFTELNHGPDFISLAVYLPSKNISNLVPLLEELIFESIFPEEEIKLKKAQKVQQIELEEKKNNVLASKKFREILFEPNHPYGRRITKRDIKDVNRAQIIEHYQKHVIGKSFKIFLAGNFSNDQLKEIEYSFGKRKHSNSENKQYFPVDTKEVQNVKIDKSGNQASIRLGSFVIKHNHEDFLKFQFLNTVLGGYFGSRLIKNIREEKGLTYGIFSSLVNLKNKTYLAISTESKRDSIDMVLEQVYHEIKKLKDQPIPYDELQTTKNYLLGAFQRSFDNSISIVDRHKKAILFDYDDDYFNNYLDTINSTTSEECIRIANEYFNEKEFSSVIVS
ncbi:MAG: pitrilysin family protein [Bacteroidota bacterium]